MRFQCKRTDHPLTSSPTEAPVIRPLKITDGPRLDCLEGWQWAWLDDNWTVNVFLHELHWMWICLPPLHQTPTIYQSGLAGPPSSAQDVELGSFEANVSECLSLSSIHHSNTRPLNTQTRC